MPNLIPFKGLNSYMDEDANNSIIEYVLKSRYCDAYDFGGLMCYPLNTQSVINQFCYVQGLKPSLKKKLHHFTLSMDDIDDEIHVFSEIMQLTVEYFSSLGYQVITAHHYRSDNDSGLHPHIHVVLNNISMYGDIFYASNATYRLFLSYLNGHTPYTWQLCFENGQAHSLM